MTGKIYQTADFVLNTNTREFSRYGKALLLSSKAFDILEYLIDHRGKVVKKSELLDAVWSDSFVEESNLHVHISALRRLMGERRGESRFIKTIQGRGYNFIAPVRELNSVAESNVNFLQQSLTQRNLSEPNSLAVLPFTFDPHHPELEYLADGLTQSLITDLSQHPTLKVLTYSSVRGYRGFNLDLQEIGFLLSADKIMTGHLASNRNELEMRVELFNASDNSHLWGAQRVFAANDVFLVKDEISTAVAKNLKLRLTEINKSSLLNQQIDAEAQKLYFRGKFVLESRSTKSNMEECLLKALDFFQQAVKKDPNYELAYTGVGEVYISLHNHQLCEKPIAYVETRKALQMALLANNRSSQAYVLKGLIEKRFEMNFVEAEKSFDRAIELNVNNAEAYHWKSNVQLILGDFKEAYATELKALELDPISTSFHVQLIRISHFAEDYEMAIFHAQELIEFEKNYVAPHAFLSVSYADLGLFEVALDYAEKTVELRLAPETLLLKAHILALASNNIESERIISEVLDKFPSSQIDPGGLAHVYSALGKTEEAFEKLEEAFKIASTSLLFLRMDKRYKNLRHDSRFRVFLKKLNLI